MREITEAVLEMHFHRAIVEHFSKVYRANFLRLLKPSPQREVWVGFDQGWVHTKLTPEQLLQELSEAIQSSAQNVQHFYLGYFLQFKYVQKITKRSYFMPEKYKTPYFRSELSVKRNPRTKLSQHETLLRLSKIHSTKVCYVCAMLFDLAEIYAPPDLARLLCIDIRSSPQGWLTNERHFITFQQENGFDALWCSEPTPARVYNFSEWASSDSLQAMKAKDVIQFLKSSAQELKTQREREKDTELLPEDIKLLPESLTVLEFDKK